MIVKYAFYDMNGCIKSAYVGDAIQLQNPNGLNVLASQVDFDIKDNYVLNGILTACPAQIITLDKLSIIANGVDSITLSGVAAGSTVRFHNLITGDVISGPISGTDTFKTNVPGAIAITIINFPYLDWEQTINAV